MLINTVVLFLRDTLPIFLLISVLLALPRVSAVNILWRLFALIFIALLTYPKLGLVSEFYEGAGFELLKTLLFFIAWIGMCFLASYGTSNSSLLSIGVSLLVLGIGLPNSLHFLVYFISELTRNSDSTLLLLGTTIGLGISISIAILLNIFLTHFVNLKVTQCFISVFVAAQAANIALLLEQTDTFPSPNKLWDSSDIVSDNSEYGHLLNALVGYEATPSISYIVVFLIALIVPNLITFLCTRQRSTPLMEAAC